MLMAILQGIRLDEWRGFTQEHGVNYHETFDIPL
jgi:hypothetical protein